MRNDEDVNSIVSDMNKKGWTNFRNKQLFEWFGGCKGKNWKFL